MLFDTLQIFECRSNCLIEGQYRFGSAFPPVDLTGDASMIHEDREVSLGWDLNRGPPDSSARCTNHWAAIKTRHEYENKDKMQNEQQSQQDVVWSF